MILALAASLLLAAAGTSSPERAADAPGLVLDRVVAAVNDEAITLSEVQEEGHAVVRKIFEEFIGSERERRMEQMQQQLLNDLIDRRLMLQVARREGTLPSQADVQAALEDLKKQNNITDEAQFRAALKTEGLTLEQVKRSVTESMAIGRLLAKQIRSSIILSEDEIAAYYERHKDEQYQRRPEVEIRHILVAVGDDDVQKAQARAEEALEKIRAGMDFAAAAKAYSDSATKGDGGHLGRIHRGDLAPDIEAAAFSLKAGEVSGLIRTSGGFNILKVERVWAEPYAPLAEVRDAIRDRLFQERFEAKRKDWVAGLRAKASIQVLAEPTARELNMDPLEQKPQAAAPDSGDFKAFGSPTQPGKP